MKFESLEPLKVQVISETPQGVYLKLTTEATNLRACLYTGRWIIYKQKWVDLCMIHCMCDG